MTCLWPSRVPWAKLSRATFNTQQHQPFQDGFRAGRRADGADDFSFMGWQFHNLKSLWFIVLLLSFGVTEKRCKQSEGET